VELAVGSRNIRDLRRTPVAGEPADAPPDDYGAQGRPEWLDIDWSQHLRSAVVRGARVNYVEIGTGSPIVFVHGLSGCWQNWLENIPFFARSHRVIAVDLPGFGSSELPNEEISIPGYGRFVDAFLEDINVERAAIVGNSMGGFIAAETAIATPHRVERLVLVSAAGGLPIRVRERLGLGALRISYPLTPAVIGRRDTLMRRPRIRAAMLATVVRYPARMCPELVWEVVAGAGKPGFLSATTALAGYDFRDRVPSIDDPTLIIWGRSDQIVPVRGADVYERLIPGARKVIFEKTGHLPMLERPPRFNRLVEEFLAEPGAVDGVESV
jgi:pimeloyl-ACP methyl ester carboxylesterase